MASKDPAFLFYPGDYLRDTQCLSERVQVAYDRIMCEHMRNICISQSQLNFFTKRLSEDEKAELEMVLTKVEDCYQISWVAESINQRRNYSESRRKNRTSKKKEDINNISFTYDKHMENENVIVNNTNKSMEEIFKISASNIFEQKQFWLYCHKITKLSEPELKQKWAAFIELREVVEDFKTAKELKEHFINWLKKQPKATKSTRKEPVIKLR